MKSENRLGSSDHVFNDVLSEYYGWSEADFKRELSQELLQQAVVAKLDTSASSSADSALTKLKSGSRFCYTCRSGIHEDPATKGNGGQYPSAITINDRIDCSNNYRCYISSQTRSDFGYIKYWLFFRYS